MVAQTIERTETRPTELTDQPAGLTAPESSAYVRGYSRGCLAYVRKHGGPSMVLEGPAPAAGTPARRQLAAQLREITTAHLIERHPAAHRAGMAALRKYRKTHGIAEPVAPAAPRKTSPRNPRALAAVPDPAPVVVDDAPADTDAGHVYVTATVRDRDGAPTDVYAGSMPDWAWSDPAHARVWKSARRREILADRTTDPRGWRVTFRSSSLAWSAAPGDVAPDPAPAPVVHASFARQYGSVTDTGPACANVDRIADAGDLEDVPGLVVSCADCLAVVASVPAAPVVESAPVVTIAPEPAADETTEQTRPNRTRRAARRQLAEDMRARGEDPTDAAAWAAAKLAAGIK